MTWSNFLIAFTIFTAVFLFINRQYLKKKTILLAKTLAFTVTTTFVYDYIAYDRDFWSFSKLWEVEIINNPIENSIFVTLLTINLILLYLKTRDYFSK